MAPAQRVIRPGDVVTLEFSLRTADGEVIESTDDGEPFAYLDGAGNILPGLEDRLRGRPVGEPFELVIPCAEAFGERVEQAEQPVPRDVFPEELELEVGAGVELEGPQGDALVFWVTRIEETEVFLDPNHPLAGEDLHFSGQVREIRDATADERAHGHPHGPGGHH